MTIYLIEAISSGDKAFVNKQLAEEAAELYFKIYQAAK